MGLPLRLSDYIFTDYLSTIIGIMRKIKKTLTEISALFTQNKGDQRKKREAKRTAKFSSKRN